MRRTAVIAVTAGAVIALGGGIALAFDGEGVSPGSAGRTAMTTSASPEAEAGTPTADPSTTTSPSTPTTPTTIDRAEAERIALRTVPGGRVESVEREIEHGRAVWDVDVIARGAKHEVDIDVQTGKVLKHGTGHDDKGNDNRGHDDRGHDDRGHDDRGYDDRGYDDN
jgi:hypothetical protein